MSIVTKRIIASSSKWIKPFIRTFSEESRGFIPRRAVLYVPAYDTKKVEKIVNLDVDCAVLNCEDGVSMNKKQEARENVVKILDNESYNFGRTDVVVRVNSVQSGLANEDLNVILEAGNLPKSIMIPKVDSLEEFTDFTKMVGSMLQNKDKSLTKECKIIIFIESALGLINLNPIVKAAVTELEGSLVTLDAIVFGSDDYCADIGAVRSVDNLEILYARQKIVAAAKAYNLQAIDMVDIDFNDLDMVRKNALQGMAMGFTGKQVIHPNQIPVVQEAFSPTTDKIDWARKLIAAYEHDAKEGGGVITFDGKMIDQPLYKQALNVVQFADYVKNTQ